MLVSRSVNNRNLKSLHWYTLFRCGDDTIVVGVIVTSITAINMCILLRHEGCIRFLMLSTNVIILYHDDVIKWKHLPRYWPFVWEIHRSPVQSPHKGQWHDALMFSLICVWINDWVNNREASDLRRYRAHYDVTVMTLYHVIYTISIVYLLKGRFIYHLILP